MNIKMKIKKYKNKKNKKINNMIRNSYNQQALKQQ